MKRKCIIGILLIAFALTVYDVITSIYTQTLILFHTISIQVVLLYTGALFGENAGYLVCGLFLLLIVLSMVSILKKRVFIPSIMLLYFGVDFMRTLFLFIERWIYVDLWYVVKIYPLQLLLSGSLFFMLLKYCWTYADE